MSNLKHDIHVNHVARLFPVTHSLTADVTKRFEPTIQHAPAVPAIDWTAIGKKAPVPVNITGSELPTADAVVITWADAKVAFGFVRNISDPVQNVALPAKLQGNWGEAVYSVYGLYTSYNGALTAWAVLDAQL